MSVKILEKNNIQYTTIDGVRWLYNIKNDRLIKSLNPIEDYLGDVENVENPLYDFYHSPYKRKLLDYKFIRLIIDSAKIRGVQNFILVLQKWYLVLPSLIINCFALPYIIHFSKITDYIPSFRELILLYLISTLLILPLHEYAHFSVYHYYIEDSKIEFGFSLRYFVLPLFYTKVPFYKSLNKDEKSSLILAGVKIQVMLWSVLTLVGILWTSDLVIGLIVINATIIIANMLPFLKFDGYWWISNALEVDDYLIYFKKMLLKQAPFRLEILLLSLANMVMLMIVELFTILPIIVTWIGHIK